jgi:hypothetical protein
LKRIIVGRVIASHVGWDIDQLNTAALATFQVIKFITKAEHNFASVMNLIPVFVPADFASVHLKLTTSNIENIDSKSKEPTQEKNGVQAKTRRFDHTPEREDLVFKRSYRATEHNYKVT